MTRRMEEDDVVEIMEDGSRVGAVGNQPIVQRYGAMEGMLHGGSNAAGGYGGRILANRSRIRSFQRYCVRCSLPGHNSVTCGRPAMRFRLPERICRSCGHPGHYGSLCPNASVPVLIGAVNRCEEGQPEDHAVELEADTDGRICKWHEMTKQYSKLFH
ncbi:unnamed protein product [Urochloa humidicola]